LFFIHHGSLAYPFSILSAAVFNKQRSGGNTTASISLCPDTFHGRSAYTRNPPHLNASSYSHPYHLHCVLI
jgi:hypothetical protein